MGRYVAGGVIDEPRNADCGSRTPRMGSRNRLLVSECSSNAPHPPPSHGVVKVKIPYMYTHNSNEAVFYAHVSVAAECE